MPFLAQKWGVDLTFAAKQYQFKGWSVIPLLGSLDSERVKHPAIKWGRYQYTHPTTQEFDHWFIEKGFGGLGVVCGRVSKLAVLDFDDAALVSEFRHQLPHLTDTYTVQSGARRLPHYYYYLSDHLDACSRSVPGADFRGDGAYVVAPPTGVGDVQWRLVKDVPLHVLSADDLKATWRFLGSTVPKTAGNSLQGPSGSNLSLSAAAVESSLTDMLAGAYKCRNSDTSGRDLLTLYKARVNEGRNHALFQTACIARDRGLDKSVVIRVLAVAHSLQPARNGARESVEKRHIEAVRTIESAYQRPARPVISVVASVEGAEKSVGIPTLDISTSAAGLLNVVREWLLGHQSVAAARVLDGLLLAGIPVGSAFTERQACEWLQRFQIGRRSIVAALKSILPDGKPLFEKVSDPLHTPSIQANAARHPENDQKKCDSVRGANRVKTSGRPSAYYILPDNEELLRRLALQESPADALGVDDLNSPTTYRRALHREMVRRRPGSYSRQWMAERLGVSKWTSRRYEAALHIVVDPMYVEQPVRWLNVEALVPRTLDDVRPGTFLETEEGKRYPPLRAIAVGLLEAGHKLVHKTRTTNHYSLPDPLGVGIPTPATGIEPQSAVMHIPRTGTGNSYSHSATEPVSNTETIEEQLNRKTRPSTQGVGIPTPELPAAQITFWICPSCLKAHIATDPPAVCPRCNTSIWDRIPASIWRDPERLKIEWQTRWREKHPTAPRRVTPLLDSRRCRNSDTMPALDHDHSNQHPTQFETIAQTIHERIPDLSRINALRLVTRYGVQAVERALACLKTRSHVRNPAGFLISLLKSEHLFCNADQPRSSRRTVQDAAEWVQKLSESPYVGFLVNADEFGS